MIYFISKQKSLIEDVDSFRKKPINISSDMSKVTSYLDNLNSKMFTLDTETDDLDPHTNTLLLIQVGDDKDQYVVDFRHPEIHKLFPYLADDSYLKLLANAKFDYKQIWKHCGIHIDNVYDVLLMDRLIYNGVFTKIEERIFKLENKYGRFSLEGLGIKYLKRRLDKAVRSTFVGHKGDFTESQIIYAAGDIDVPYLLKPILDEKIIQYSLEKVAELENKVTVAFAEMEFNGILLDINRWMEIYQINVDKLQKVEENLDQIIREDPELFQKYGIGKQLGMFAGTDKRDVKIKWSSSKQKAELLGDTLGFDLLVKDKKSGEYKNSVDINVIQKYKDEHPLIKPLIKYSEISKLISAYGDKFLKHLNDSTKRIHGEIFQIKDTGRTGMGNPNMQNIPAKTSEDTPSFRSCFVAPPGKKLITTDYSNMELRIVADKSGEKVLIDAFLRGEDVHSSMAMMIQKTVFGKQVKISKTENSDLRYESKTITFLIIYGGSEFKLKDELQIVIERATELIQAYFRSFPKLKAFSDSLKSFGVRKGYIRTFKPYNRIRWFPQMKKLRFLKNIRDLNKEQYKTAMKLKGEIERASSNTPVQGSAADIMKRACYDLHKKIIIFNQRNNVDFPDNNDRVKLVLQVHDEIVSEVPDGFCDEIAELTKKVMERAGIEVMTHIPMVAEPNIDTKWDH